MMKLAYLLGLALGYIVRAEQVILKDEPLAEKALEVAIIGRQRCLTHQSDRADYLNKAPVRLDHHLPTT